MIKKELTHLLFVIVFSTNFPYLSVASKYNFVLNVILIKIKINDYCCKLWKLYINLWVKWKEYISIQTSCQVIYVITLSHMKSNPIIIMTFISQSLITKNHQSNMIIFLSLFYFKNIYHNYFFYYWLIIHPVFGVYI